MLVLTRAIGESFRIGDDVEILVADTSGVAAKLEIKAPRHIKVNRKKCMNALLQRRLRSVRMLSKKSDA